jgi:hypothetical protein
MAAGQVQVLVDHRQIIFKHAYMMLCAGWLVMCAAKSRSVQFLLVSGQVEVQSQCQSVRTRSWHVTRLKL